MPSQLTGETGPATGAQLPLPEQTSRPERKVDASRQVAAAEWEPRFVESFEWEHLRGLAPVAHVHTERFEPRSDGGKSHGRLRGWMTGVAYESRLMEVAPGRWVREFTVRVEVRAGEGVAPELVERRQNEVLELVGASVNRRHHRGGVQLHLRVEFGDRDPVTGARVFDGPVHREVVLHDGGHSHQGMWSAQARPSVLVHELLHNLGLMDEYRDPAALYTRRTQAAQEPPGVMGVDAWHGKVELLPHHVEAIFDIADSSTVQHSLPYNAEQHPDTLVTGAVTGPQTPWDTAPAPHPHDHQLVHEPAQAPVPHVDDEELETLVRNLVQQGVTTVRGVTAALRADGIRADNGRVRWAVHQAKGTQPQRGGHVADEELVARVRDHIQQGVTTVRGLVAALREDGIHTGEARVLKAVHEVKGTQPHEGQVDDDELLALVRDHMQRGVTTLAGVVAALRADGIHTGEARVRRAVHEVKGTQPHEGQVDDDELLALVRDHIQRGTTTAKDVTAALRADGIHAGEGRVQWAVHQVKGTQPQRRGGPVDDDELVTRVRDHMLRGVTTAKGVGAALRADGIRVDEGRVRWALHEVKGTQPQRGGHVDDEELVGRVRDHIQRGTTTVKGVRAALRADGIHVDEGRVRWAVHEVKGTQPQAQTERRVDDEELVARVRDHMQRGVTTLAGVGAAVRADGIRAGEGRVRWAVHEVRGTQPNEGRVDDEELVGRVRDLVQRGTTTATGVRAALRADGIHVDEGRVRWALHEVKGTQPQRGGHVDDDELVTLVRDLVQQGVTTIKGVTAALREGGIRVDEARVLKAVHQVKGTQPQRGGQVDDDELVTLVRDLVQQGVTTIKGVGAALREGGVHAGEARVQWAVRQVKGTQPHEGQVDDELVTLVRDHMQRGATTARGIVAPLRADGVRVDEGRVSKVVHEVRGTQPQRGGHVDDEELVALVRDLVQQGTTTRRDVVAALRADGIHTSETRVRWAVHEVKGTQPRRGGRVDDEELLALVRDLVQQGVTTRRGVVAALRADGIHTSEARVSKAVHEVRGTQPHAQAERRVEDGGGDRAGAVILGRAAPSPEPSPITASATRSPVFAGEMMEEDRWQSPAESATTSARMEDLSGRGGRQSGRDDAVADAAAVSGGLAGDVSGGRSRNDAAGRKHSISFTEDANTSGPPQKKPRNAFDSTGANAIDANGVSGVSATLAQIASATLAQISDLSLGGRGGAVDAQHAAAAGLGLEIGEVPADGDCFYWAVMGSVPQEVWGPRLGMLGYESTVSGLRNALADAYRQIQVDNILFRTATAHEGGQSWQRVEEDMRTPGRWDGASGDIAPQLVAMVLDVNIMAIQRDGGLSSQGALIRDDRSTYYIVYNGTDHYMATRPLRQAPSGDGSTGGFAGPGVPPRSGTADRPADTGHTDVPHPPPVSSPLVQHLDQARTETIWPENADHHDDELRIVRVVHTHAVTPAAGMDDMFPWRDSTDPGHRVYAPYADEDGGVHPFVREHADQITVHMYAAGKKLLTDIARDETDTRLPASAVDRLNSVWPQLQAAVLGEVQRLVRGEPHAAFPVRVGTVHSSHVQPHEHMLVGQQGLFLFRKPADMFLEEQPSLLNGRILGLYLGAVIRNEEALSSWQQRYSTFPAYAMDLDAEPSLTCHVMSAEGAANSIAFANTAITDGPEPAIDRARVNAQFVEFKVKMPTSTGGYLSQSVMVLVALDNAFDILSNPEGIVIADYGDGYLENFKKNTDTHIKTEPTE